VRADLDYLAGVLVAHQHTGWRCKATVVDVQVAAANVGGHELEYDSMLDFPPLWIGQLGISGVADF